MEKADGGEGEGKLGLFVGKDGDGKPEEESGNEA